jgi:hypothetical protein
MKILKEKKNINIFKNPALKLKICQEKLNVNVLKKHDTKEKNTKREVER